MTNPRWAGGSITTTIKPANEQRQNGWWLIDAEFWGRTAIFRAFYPERPPTARRFFRDLFFAIDILNNRGPLEAVVKTGGMEGGLTAKEALGRLEDHDRKMRYLLDTYYPFFESGDEKFFAVFIE